MSAATDQPGLRPCLRTWRLVVAACTLLGCAAAQQTQTAAAPVARDVIARSAAPYYALHAGRPLDEVQLLRALSEVDAVCIGEQHGSAVHQYIEWQLVLRLGYLLRQQGYQLGLGLEMLSTSKQEALDRFRTSRISEQDFLAQADWQHEWGYSFQYYRPAMQSAARLGADWVALNAPRAWVKAVARRGPGALADTPLGADFLDLSYRPHREFFAAALGVALTPSPDPASTPKNSPSHPNGSHGGMSPEHLYAAQVLWDTHMAEIGARWLRGGTRRKLVVLAGAGHCHRSAIPYRLAQRGLTALAAHAVRQSQRTPEEEASPAADGEAFELEIVLQD